MTTINQNTTYYLPILLISAANHVDGLSGLDTINIAAKKYGGEFATITPTIIDRGYGWYDVVLVPTMTDTLGALILHITADGADPLDVENQVGNATTDDLANMLTNILSLIGVGGNQDIADELSNGAPIRTYYPFEDEIPSAITGNLFSASKLWYALKREEDADVDALVFIGLEDGLTTLAGEDYEGISTNGALEILGSVGNWTVKINLNETAQLQPYINQEFPFEIKALINSVPILVASGTRMIKSGIVRALA